MRLPVVDDDRQTEVVGQPELRLEDLLLHVARREIVVVVEPDLPDRDDLGVARVTGDGVEVARREGARLVRVHPRRAVEIIIRVGEREPGGGGFHGRSRR